MNHIVKRAQHNEPYDERKLYASIFSACQAAREPERSAELIAEQVTKDINEWIVDKHEVTSHDIRVKASQSLKMYQPNASFGYLHHRVVW